MRNIQLDNFIDLVGEGLFGRKRSRCLDDEVCISCGSSVCTATGFRDHGSVKEYHISALCQHCQDRIFGEGR
jgi:hypothetical protein